MNYKKNISDCIEINGVEVLSLYNEPSKFSETSLDNSLKLGSNKILRHLDFIELSKGGDVLLLGSNNLTSHPWSGSIWCFNDDADDNLFDDGVVDKSKALAGYKTQNGVSKGLFINEENTCSGDEFNKYILTALDNGTLEIFHAKFDDSSNGQIDSIASLEEHDDLISDLCLMQDGTRAVSVSYDATMLVLDLQTFEVLRRIEARHGLMLAADTAKTSNDILATAGTDGCVRLLDVRDPSSNSCVFRDMSDWPTSLAWKPFIDNQIMVGCDSGKLQLRDVRNTTQSIFTLTKMMTCVSANKKIGARIHKIKYLDGSQNFAVCSDSPVVCVFGSRMSSNDSLITLECCYQNGNSHRDFVRGLAWRPEKTCNNGPSLFSCGWDTCLRIHFPLMTRNL